MFIQKYMHSSHLVRINVVFCISCTDIVFNFRTTYVNTKGEVVYNYRCIALNYLTGKARVGYSQKSIIDRYPHSYPFVGLGSSYTLPSPKIIGKTKDTHSETGDPARLPAQLARRWGQRN